MKQIRTRGDTFLTIGILILVVITSINTYSHTKQRRTSPQNKNGEILENKGPYYYPLLGQFTYALGLELDHLGDFPLYLGSDTIRTLRMSELCQDTTIILYFTDDMCTPCINFSVSKLIEWFPNYRENRNVILLTSGIEDKFRNSFYGKPVCCLKNEEQNMLQSEVPLFFLIYPDLTIHFVFVPYENAPEFTDSYLRTIRSRFF